VAPEPEPPAPAPAAPEIAAEAPPMPPLAAAGPATPPAPAGGSPDGSASGPGSGSEVGDGAGAVLPGTVGLQPRVLVVHRTPKLVEQRRIDDAVQLEARVGTDGRVLEVRVVRHIPDCEPCTASAVEAALQYVYDPSIVPAGASDVWIGPIGIGFRYRK
jgi:outer membrane biosynthesis protein TonB